MLSSYNKEKVNVSFTSAHWLIYLSFGRATLLGRIKHVYVDMYALNLFIEHSGEHWWEQNIFCSFTTRILANLGSWCFEHSGDIICSLFVKPSTSNTSMNIYNAWGEWTKKHVLFSLLLSGVLNEQIQSVKAHINCRRKDKKLNLKSLKDNATFLVSCLGKLLNLTLYFFSVSELTKTTVRGCSSK